MTYSEQHKDIDKKWQDRWFSSDVFKAETGGEKKKFYALIEFPYPSGQGLHVGHTRPYTALDVIARRHRREGENVLLPIGWDAFGLPTENFAIKNRIHPEIVTENNIVRFREQCKALGYSFDYSREVNTTAPDYYKWTQWIFLKMFEHGWPIKKMAVNCAPPARVLANEEVVAFASAAAARLLGKKEQWSCA